MTYFLWAFGLLAVVYGGLWMMNVSDIFWNEEWTMEELKDERDEHEDM